MRYLSDCKEKIHSCSKCGLCQSVCPIYKITGNDCTVSRGHFIMLSGLIKGDLKMSKTINNYLDLCLKCGACSKFCPSGIDVVDIVALAKAEYFKKHPKEKLISFFQKHIVLGLFLNLAGFVSSIFGRKLNSKKYDKKVIYFGGCGGKCWSRGKYGGKYRNTSVIKILNSLGIEVITPNFDCCGLPFFLRGDMETFREYMKKFFAVLDKYENYDIVTNCASCEKALKSYEKWGSERKIVVKNVFDIIKESGVKLQLKQPQTVTFHKPCNLNNYDIVEAVLNDTKNLNYIKMNDYDKCCGFNGLGKLSRFGIIKELLKEKRKNIKDTGAKIVLTSCLACEITLKIISLGRYRVYDFMEFLAKNIK